MRFFSLVALMVILAGPAEAATPGRLEFELLRNDRPEGRHVVTVTQTSDGLDVRSQIDIRVRVGPVTAFRYEQTCREGWSDGALHSLNCTTVKGGRRTVVTARRQAGDLVVVGAGGDATFPLNALPTSWWVKPPLSGALIDTQTGQPLRARVERVGRETLQIGGAPVVTEHIRVVGTISADLWYDLQGRWVGCAFTASGQRFVYRLVSPVASAPSGV
jgi:Family of unknown function (DUF6134)